MVITTVHTHKSGVIFHTFPPASNKTKIKLRPKMTKIASRESCLEAGPLEAILVIFGRSFLNSFLFERSWKNMKMTPLLCACAVVITLETQKCRKRHVAPLNLTFLSIAIHRNGFRRMKEEEQIYKTLASKFLIFAWGRSHYLSKFTYTLNSESKALTGNKSEGIKSRGVAEAFIRRYIPT